MVLSDKKEEGPRISRTVDTKQKENQQEEKEKIKKKRGARKIRHGLDQPNTFLKPKIPFA